MRLQIVALLGALALQLGAAASAEDTKETWKVAEPPLPTRDVKIDVTEGTWMSLDVSPDGKTIAFDLLGDIYTLPMTGGDAKNISSGLPWEYQPRFSNDGTRIAMTSDRGGGDNIWLMNIDGSDKRQLTKEDFRLLNNASWSPDDRFIVAKKHFTTARSLGTGEIWLYHISGGKGLALVERPSEAHQKELGEPIFSPDGRYVYFALNTTPGTTFEYAQDSNTSLFAIDRYDMETGKRDRIVDGHGGAVRPAPSPDGKSIAFVRRERTQSGLYVKDMTSGEITKLYGNLDQDMQEGWAVQGLYPNMDWTPDGKSIVFWSGGKINRIDVASKAVTNIPFRVKDTRQIVDPPRPSVEVAPDTFTTKLPRFAQVSPTGDRVVFETLGKLYVKALPNGKVTRLTGENDASQELFPSWSGNGEQVVFVKWSDAGLGAVQVITPGSAARTVTDMPGHYRRPQFSPDGSAIVFEKGSGGYLFDAKWSEAPGVYTVPASGGTMRLINDSGSHPHFGKTVDRVFVTMRGEKGSRELVSMDMNGEAHRTHASGGLVTGFHVAPDERHIAFSENYQAYVMPMVPGPQTASAGLSASALPVSQVSGDGAAYFNWSTGNQINWTLGDTLFSAKVSDLVAAAPSAADDEDGGYKAPTTGVSLSMTQTADKPDGTIALVGARIVTMADESGGVIEDGVVIIKANRIQTVGARTDVNIPSDAEIVDVAGKTIIPGLIDAHAHGPQGRDDIIPDQNWSAVGHLALGVTTIHDPSSTASEIFTAGERQRAGTYLSPRIYSSGEIVYGAKSPTRFALINSKDDALEHVRRLKVQGAHSIKNYNQPRRDQRQQVVAAALEENIAVVAEGGSLFHMDMALVADGNTSIEHNLPQSALYEDVLSFFSASKVAYTPTLVVTFGGLAGDPYWRDVTEVWKHPILSKHTPPHVLQPKSVRRPTAPESDYRDKVSAATAKALSERGVPVSIGGHGQEEGLAAHWEMWSFVRGGMSPLQALQAATITPAKHLGFGTDIGSLEKGKLADLVILSANPLDDIANSDKIEHVMLNGRLYRAETMQEEVSGDAALAPYYWD